MLAISTAVLSFIFLYLRYHARGGAFAAITMRNKILDHEAIKIEQKRETVFFKKHCYFSYIYVEATTIANPGFTF